jgi:hypothetical protein
MKRLTILFCFTAIIALLSCEQEQECDNISACTEDPPPAQTCMAYWESWFYNDETNSCELIGYSGCGPAGFETKEECEKCGCN